MIDSISVSLNTLRPSLNSPEVSLLAMSTGVPVQESCHSFQIVPISNPANALLPKFEASVSKPPTLLITNYGALSVSFHSSVSGVN